MLTGRHFDLMDTYIQKEVTELRKMYYALATKVHMDLEVDARMELIKQFTDRTNNILKASSDMKEAGLGVTSAFQAIATFCEEQTQDHNTDEDEEDE